MDESITKPKKRKSRAKKTTPYVTAALKYMVDHAEYNPLTLITQTSPEIIATSIQGSVVKALKHSQGYIDALYKAYVHAKKKLGDKAPDRLAFSDIDEEIQSMLSRLREIAESDGVGAVSAAKEYLDRIELRRKQDDIPEDVAQDARTMAEGLLRTKESVFCKDCRSKYADIVTGVMEEIGQ